MAEDSATFDARMGNTSDGAFTSMPVPFLSDLEDNWLRSDAKKSLVRMCHGPIYYAQFPIAIGYMVAIFSLQKLMSTRKPFSLRGPLLAWNILLSVYSFVVAYRLLPELLDLLRTDGFTSSVCSDRLKNSAISLWAWTFSISKVFEMGDTLFIVLRKQKLIFLHWYHHVVTMMYCWYSIYDQSSSARWFTVMNSVIHTAMYAYYAARVLRIGIPRFVNVALTFTQLMQMVVGLVVNVVAYQAKEAGRACDTTYENIRVSILIYLSYVVLFANFFYQSYVRKAERKAKAKRDKCNNNDLKQIRNKKSE